MFERVLGVHWVLLGTKIEFIFIKFFRINNLKNLKIDIKIKTLKTNVTWITFLPQLKKKSSSYNYINL